MNSLQYSEVQTMLTRLEALANQVETALNGISNLIESSVNSNAGIFDGRAAAEFMEKWAGLSEELPTFIENFKKQAKNVETILSNTQTADQY